MMNPILKNIIAIVAGIIAGMIVNGGIVVLSGSFIAPPEGVNPNDIESMKAAIDSYKAKHFIFPFLAHALGTLIGAYIAAKIAATHKKTFALIIGGFFLIGGTIMAFMLPVIWFIIIDLSLAYIPMGWLGWKLNKKRN